MKDHKTDMFHSGRLCGIIYKIIRIHCMVNAKRQKGRIMKDEGMEVTGYFSNGTSPVAFYMDNFRMTILDTRESFFDGGFYLNNQDGYLYGFTHRGMQFAAFVENYQIRVNGIARINTGIYVIGQSYHSFPTTTFSIIRFRGGTLNKLFEPKALDIDFRKGEDIPVKQFDDSVKYEFSTDAFNCVVTIQSNVIGKAGSDGNTLQNDEIILSLQFDKEQPFSSIKQHYFHVMNCLSFMTNRKNVGVDSIQLMSDDGSEQGKHWFDVFVKNDSELTGKDRHRCLEFSDLGDSVSTLFDLIYSNKENKRKLSLGFFPEKDNQINMVSNEIIRSTCAALECEASFITFPEEDKAIDDLRRHVKSLIRKYRKLHKKEKTISDRTYSLIHGSMRYWSLSATEKIIHMYHMHQEAMQPFPLENSAIADFIRYRNGITHGADQYISLDIATTTYKLKALVYCCLLSRIGISEDKIISLCRIKINT